MRFSIDTSAILDAYLRHYPQEAFPGLWRHLEGAGGLVPILS